MKVAVMMTSKTKTFTPSSSQIISSSIPKLRFYTLDALPDILKYCQSTLGIFWIWCILSTIWRHSWSIDMAIPVEQTDCDTFTFYTPQIQLRCWQCVPYKCLYYYYNNTQVPSQMYSWLLIKIFKSTVNYVVFFKLKWQYAISSMVLFFKAVQ